MPTPVDSKLYQLMADRVTDYAIFLLDPRGNILSWNAGAAAIKQYHASEIIGRHFSIFYTPADIERKWPDFELERATMEGRFEDEGWRVRKDGSRFWANVVITALRDDNGTLLAFSKITRDLSERKKQEEIMRESEERFRLLVDGVQDYAIYMLSPTGLVTSWNSGARRIKGYEAAEIVGKHFSRFYTSEDVARGKPWAELAIARETGRAEDEGWRVRKDGSRFWARVVVTALLDANGSPRGFAKVTQDLTQRRHSEQIEQLASNLNNFIAILAHELRNPLAPIRNAVELQKLLPPEDPAQKKWREVIERQSGQLNRIVDDLLDISRVTRGTLSIDRKPVAVTAVLERAVEAARPAIDAANHTLRVEVPAEPLEIEVDEVRIVQALTNVLNNAARYTDPGGAIFVTVSAIEREGKGEVSFSVRDTGRGIAPDLLPSIFGMFVQGKDVLNRPVGGLGVGLALARSIVELHHGTLEATSAGPGKGAEFILRLPASPARTAPLKSDRAKTKCLALDKSPARRILVVDDNADAAAVLAAILSEHGHEVVAVTDATKALSTCEGFRPHVVLLDIGMPGMNGLEIARHLRERAGSPRPLIVAVTGWAKSEDEARSREAGFDLHLVKPVEEAALLSLLGTYSGSIH
jgi:PAS domain S-box-containing protein